MLHGQQNIKSGRYIYKNFPISNSMSIRSPILDFPRMKRYKGRQGTGTVGKDVMPLCGRKNVSAFWKKPYIHSSENLNIVTQSETKWHIFGIQSFKTYRMYSVGATVLTRAAGGQTVTLTDSDTDRE